MHPIVGFTLLSAAFAGGEFIPSKYTCAGADISPPLAWQSLPAGTQSLALIMDDPDAPMGTWDHWLMFNIPARVQELPENLATLPTGAKSGKNSWGKLGYGGPCPPSGVHRYFFRLYALDCMLTALPEGCSKQELLTAMKGHILGTAELMGKYQH